VLADANIDDASRGIVFGAFINSGQVCLSTERVIVQRPVAESLIAAIKQLVENLVAGDPKDSFISSMFTDGSAENVSNLIKDAKANGAELLVGNGANSGALLQPHVVLNVHPGMKIWKQETFGPGTRLLFC
jgi:acyl-CoA reductase-like NAD-dependent aldehyde dehydrogenase